MSEETDRKRRFSDVGDWVARVGIPAAIAFVLLWQTNSKLDALVQKIDRLCIVVESRK